MNPLIITAAWQMPNLPIPAILSIFWRSRNLSGFCRYLQIFFLYEYPHDLGEKSLTTPNLDEKIASCRQRNLQVMDLWFWQSKPGTITWNFIIWMFWLKLFSYLTELTSMMFRLQETLAQEEKLQIAFFVLFCFRNIPQIHWSEHWTTQFTFIRINILIRDDT